MINGNSTLPSFPEEEVDLKRKPLDPQIKIIYLFKFIWNLDLSILDWLFLVLNSSQTYLTENDPLGFPIHQDLLPPSSLLGVRYHYRCNWLSPHLINDWAASVYSTGHLWQTPSSQSLPQMYCFLQCNIKLLIWSNCQIKNYSSLPSPATKCIVPLPLLEATFSSK